MEGTMKTLNLYNLEKRMEKRMEENGIKIEERMGHIEYNFERIVKILQNIY
jgi:hypothetical protein